MIPPTSIDGTDITGATIDGSDVQEITVDGQTVFTAETLPVAFSNLVAWYPFDSAEYGGSNADDVTAIIGGSGDDTAYNGVLNNGPSYRSSDGVTDIKAGANSGAFEFFGNDQHIRSNSPATLNAYTVSFFVKTDTLNKNQTFVATSSGTDTFLFIVLDSGDQEFFPFGITTNAITANTYHHVVMTADSSGNAELYVDGQSEGTATGSFNSNPTDFVIGTNLTAAGLTQTTDGLIDDVRFYNTNLTQTQINQIFQNTKP